MTVLGTLEISGRMIGLAGWAVMVLHIFELVMVATARIRVTIFNEDK